MVSIMENHFLPRTNLNLPIHRNTSHQFKFYENFHSPTNACYKNNIQMCRMEEFKRREKITFVTIVTRLFCNFEIKNSFEKC